VFGRYTYEIIGGVLIFFSSLVGEQMPPSWKKRSYLIFGFFALVYIGVGTVLDRNAANEQGKLEKTISELTGSVSTAEKARQSDMDTFFKQLDLLNRRISDVSESAATESLRKQLDETRQSLINTQRSIEKREVELSILVNGQTTLSAVMSKRVEIPRSTIYAFPVTFFLANDSDYDTASGVIEIECSQCSGLRFAGKDPWPIWGNEGRFVARNFLSITKHSVVSLGSIYVVGHPKQVVFPNEIQIEVRYRCLLCVPQDWQPITIRLVQ
jgi:hypothetical protein